MLRNRRVRFGEMRRPAGPPLVLFLALVGLCGCGPTMGRFAGGFTKGLSRCPDPSIARGGAPACILLIEGSLSSSPDDPQLLGAAASLYSFYGAHLVENKESARRLTQRALEYALRAAAASVPGIGDARSMDFDTLDAVVGRAGKSEVPALFSLGSVWLDWISVRKDDLDAIADLPRIEVIMEHVARLDAAYRGGAVHLCLALLAATGGAEDETVEVHFGRAIKLADGKNLMPGVSHALWLRNTDNAKRCRPLLQEIVKRGSPGAPAYSLVNQLALEKARQALADMDANE